MVSRVFPSYHPKAGQETGFRAKIRAEMKLHTLRGNYELWKKRLDEVAAGKAYLSLREWSGKPYNSNQVEFHKLFAIDGVGVQKAVMKIGEFTWNNKLFRFPDVWINETDVNPKVIAHNDGLEYADFIDWFKPYDLSKPLVVIHFSDFRY